MENIFSGTSNEESLIELRAVVILISDPLGSEDNRKGYSNQMKIPYDFFTISAHDARKKIRLLSLIEDVKYKLTKGNT